MENYKTKDRLGEALTNAWHKIGRLERQRDALLNIVTELVLENRKLNKKKFRKDEEGVK